MKKIAKISLLASILFSINHSFAQDGPKFTQDKDGNWVMEGNSVYEAPESKETKDRVPPPSPVDDQKNDGDSNRSNGGAGNSNSSSGNPQSSGTDAKTDRQFDKVISDSKYREASGESSSSGKSQNGNSGSQDREGNPSKTYDQLIEKGKVAKTKVSQSVQNADFTLQKTKSKLATIVSSTIFANVDTSYKNQGRLIPSEKISRPGILIGNLVLANQNSLFSAVTKPLNIEIENFKREALKKELRALFPEVYEKNAQEVIQAKMMLRNWGLILDVIGDSIFQKEFMDAQAAIQNMQNSIDLTALGSIDSDLIKTIEAYNQKTLYRFADYLSDYIASINAQQFDTGSEQQKRAIEWLKLAFNDVYTNQDYLASANKILEIKNEFKFYETPYETAIGPDDIASLGTATIIKSLSNGLVKYEMARVLPNVIKAEDRSIFRSFVSKIDNLELGKAIQYGPHNPGPLNFIEESASRTAADNFGGGSYKAFKTEEGTKLYKSFRNDQNIYGPYFSLEKPKSQFLSYYDNAIDPAWSDKPLIGWVEIEVPKGTTIYTGRPNWINTKLGGKIYPGNNQVYLLFNNEKEMKTMINQWMRNKEYFGK